MPEDASTPIVLLASDWPPIPGGVSVHVSSLCLHSQLGMDILAPHWSWFKNPKDQEKPLPERLRLSRPDSLWDRWSYQIKFLRPRFFKRHLKRYLAGAPSTPLVICGQTMVPGGAATALAGRGGFPYIVFVYGEEFERYAGKFPYDSILKQILANARKIIAISRATKDQCVGAGADPAKVAIIHGGVDPANFPEIPPDDSTLQQRRARYGLQDKKVLLTVARIEPHKGQDTVIESLPHIAKQIPNVTYVMAGHLNQQRRDWLNALAREYGVEDRVMVLDHVQHDEIVYWYHLCDIFVMMSRNLVEGFGIVFLEAGICSRPVIGTWDGGIPDAVADGEVGFLVQPKDSQALGQKVIEILQNPELAKRLGRAGRERVLREFTWQKQGEKFGQLVQEVLQEMPPRLL
ncbi:glycosyltransferase family 4 protein [Acidobacteria bacterium AH-259-L09]|nr:glycosyltransferase family 4 protein [Acidobacteria bacterium AH-259-L09]